MQISKFTFSCRCYPAFLGSGTSAAYVSAVYVLCKAVCRRTTSKNILEVNSLLEVIFFMINYTLKIDFSNCTCFNKNIGTKTYIQIIKLSSKKKWNVN